jgi:hypothetical protein
MLGTFLVAVAALIVAILGCAWAKPVGVKERHHQTAGLRWTRRGATSDRTVGHQEN